MMAIRRYVSRGDEIQFSPFQSGGARSPSSKIQHSKTNSTTLIAVSAQLRSRVIVDVAVRSKRCLPTINGLDAVCTSMSDSRALVRSWRFRLQVLHRRSLDRATLMVVARAVTGAVPGGLGTVPRHQAAEVTADRRNRVHDAGLIAVGCSLLPIDRHDVTF